MLVLTRGRKGWKEREREREREKERGGRGGVKNHDQDGNEEIGK